MDDVLGPRKIELKVHGLSAEDHGRVAPRLFASKLKQRVNALGSADQIANGEKTHQYVLANMHMSEPTALLKEISLDEQEERVAIPVSMMQLRALRQITRGLLGWPPSSAV